MHFIFVELCFYIVQNLDELYLGRIALLYYCAVGIQIHLICVKLSSYIIVQNQDEL